MEQGIALIEQALQLAPKDVASLYNMALACKIDGQYDKAITYFKNVIAADPGNTWSYYGIATIYGDLGKAESSPALFKTRPSIWDGESVKEAPGPKAISIKSETISNSKVSSVNYISSSAISQRMWPIMICIS